MEIEELKQIFITQRELYGFLSKTITLGPKKELLERFQSIYGESLNEEEGDDNLVKGIITIQKALDGKDLASCEVVLNREYTRLFIGPGKAPVSPYASIYLSKEPKPKLMDESTIEVRKHYLESNIVMSNMSSVPDDFLGAELEYINYLTTRALELNETVDADELRILIQMQSSFMHEYMITWIPKFVQCLLELTTEDFFKGFALLLIGLIDTHMLALEEV
ncbi:putative component of anaerobic dehydrogenase [Desulfitobacterium dichloroeliminans LMG P-21439]|uniref:Putative component of anaerobic dehydrogenase n=1 Tax=Desulfitobacterium dichloroeliminans (strain LMG P-21439 / DCA1) TaxID=871963 RepID=L0F3S4_DESDL|nr:molecular chaperone TorD family protein [Desulfitobacterium dichloroeliminans]AGA68484.1 putative component of anaerobic dehydrogenase [Desulfitobacterium dichloroeliminans LMG P-21439]